MSTNTLKQKIVSGFAWQSATKLIIQLFSWTTTILVARILAPEDYGIVAIQGIFTVTIGMVVDMGVSRGLIQKDSVTEQEIDSLFYFSLLMGVTAFSLYYLVAPVIAGFYQIPELVDILRVAGLTFIFGSLKSVPVAITMREMDFKYRSLVELGGAFVNAGSLLVMAIYGFGVWALILSNLLAYLATTVAYFPIMKRIPKPRLVIREITGVISFGFKVMLTGVMFSSYMKADIFFLGKIGGDKLTGFYSMAIQLATIPLDKIGTIFNEITFPAMSRIQNDKKEAKLIFLKMHEYLLTVSLPLLIGLFFVAEDFVLILLGEKWSPAIAPLKVFALINVLRLSGMIMIPVLQGFGHPNKVLRYSGWCLALLPAAFMWGASYGIMGVMLAWAFAYPLVYCYLTIEALKVLEISWRDFLMSSSRPIVCVAIMGLFLLFFYTYYIPIWAVELRFLVAVSIGIFAYVLSYFLLYPRQFAELTAGLKQLKKS